MSKPVDFRLAVPLAKNFDSLTPSIRLRPSRSISKHPPLLQAYPAFAASPTSDQASLEASSSGANFVVATPTGGGRLTYAKVYSNGALIMGARMYQRLGCSYTYYVKTSFGCSAGSYLTLSLTGKDSMGYAFQRQFQILCL